MELCPKNHSHGIDWIASAPGAPTHADCPGHRMGQAHRVCEKIDYNKTEWMVPDFSECFSHRLTKINNEVG